jgi:predicted Zn-ribbon and HTH transcriptional regulator
LTVRQRIREALSQNPMATLDLSRALRVPEKEIIGHLEHVARSLRPPDRLVVFPPACHQCGFVFSHRSRFTTPGRCPRCRHEGISPPVFEIKKG